MGKQVLFNSQEELKEFLFATYGGGAYLMYVGGFYSNDSGDLVVYISGKPVYVNTYNSKDELIEELNKGITDKMTMDEFNKLGKVVKGICDQDEYTRIDAWGRDNVTIVIEDGYTKTLRFDYGTIGKVTVMYTYSYGIFTEDEMEYIKSKTYKLSDCDVLGNILNECQQLKLIDAYYDQVKLLKDGLDDSFIKAVKEVGYMDY